MLHLLSLASQSPPATIDALVWWAFGGVLVVCAALVRLGVWFVGQRIARIEADASQHAAADEKRFADVDGRLRAMERGEHLRAIETALADLRGEIRELRARLEERRGGP